MRSTFTALIGFSAYVFCASFCPMNMNVMAVDMNMGEHHNHMAMDDHHEGQMGHDMETGECENCESDTIEDVAFSILSVDQIIVAASYIPAAVAHIYESDHITATPKYHLAGASPPVVPNIVRTIVLRT